MADLRDIHRENRDTIDPDTQERVVLLTHKQLVALKQRIDRGLGRF